MELQSLDRSNNIMTMLNKYPDHIPVIVERDPHCTTLPDIKNKKFFVTKTLSVGNFVYCVRNRLDINEKDAIFLFVDNTLPNPSDNLGAIYEKHKSEDQMLHCTYSSDSAYGFL
ncbi:Microtubule-associated protein, putative [Trichomonas vaginalis G3]|uniref:Autophagy-related protein n=1 Tax=Trichomonas vaginalis (strain ATCC PRA-98 / G3) TaxID=412133 RepID=A2EFC3_TRIV3|nr:cellular response to nitrogen starvation [Trichomonas vaginalis G3]EAY08620.1 Microtubule-associated protein, putative [Trichomonas vaginalis G3]KAI5536734.1 cellular response to nitrogen starvation [Trichomonas vaginalis G3]|eukprot:XP_001320843.1 Microtubule-associated protein [Trichomonas vaginalis G3]